MGFVSSLFGAPKMPAPPPPPPIPTREDPAIAASKEKQRISDIARRGRASTILTGGLGDVSEAEVKRPTLG